MKTDETNKKEKNILVGSYIAFKLFAVKNHRRAGVRKE